MRIILFIALLALANPALAIDVQKVEASGGLEAWLAEDHANPIIAMHFSFRGGAALDPKGKEGLAGMASSMLDEGAGELDSQAFQARLEDLSIKLSFDADHDNFSGRLTALTENSDAAFELLRLALNQPRFDKEALERIRGQLLASLRMDLQDPAVIASRKLSSILFPGHPYGRPVDGDLESIAAISGAGLKRFVKERLARSELKIGVAGDMTPDKLAKAVNLIFGALPPKAAPWQIAAVKPKADGQTVIIKNPAPQSAIHFAQEGLKRDHEDFYAAYVINHALGGGGLNSRLQEELRKKSGLAYSVHTGLHPMDYAALISGSTGTANASAAESLRRLRGEWRKMSEQGLGADELADAKTYLTGSFPLRFSSSSNIAAILVRMQLENLGVDYLDKRNSFIEAVTLEDANRVAKSLFNADALAVVVAGEPEGLAGGD